MKLNQDQTIKNNKDQFINIIKKLEKHIGRNKEKLLEDWIQERLNKSLKQYYNQLAHAFDKLSVLTDGKEIKALRRLIIE